MFREACLLLLAMFTKNQIMMQAGTAMPTQPNMMPPQVLALLG